MAASINTLPDLPLFENVVDGNDVLANAKKVKNYFRDFEVKLGHIHQKDNEPTERQKVSAIKAVGGSKLLDIVENNPLTDAEKVGKDQYQQIKHIVNKIYQPSNFEDLARYDFFKAMQRTNENISQYEQRLRDLRTDCNFHVEENDKLLRDKLIHGCSNDRLRQKALQDKMNLKDLISLGTAMLFSNAQANQMRNKTSYVNRVSGGQDLPTCKFCGKQHEFRAGVCPAKGKQCHICHKLNHFSPMCPTSQSQSQRNQPPQQPFYKSFNRRGRGNRRGHRGGYRGNRGHRGGNRRQVRQVTADQEEQLDETSQAFADNLFIN